MRINRYDDMSPIQRDAITEVGSIGTGNAATALSGLLNHEIKMTVPAINIQGYNEAINAMGNPEEIVSGVMVRMSGELHGIMLYIQKLDLINIVMRQMFHKTVEDISELGELEMSALVEIGNIMISSYVSAMAGLSGISINLSVPAISVNMLGGILSVPMVELGYQTNKLMTIGGKFIYDNHQLDSNLLMVPDVDSLNYLLEKLGVDDR